MVYFCPYSNTEYTTVIILYINCIVYVFSCAKKHGELIGKTSHNVLIWSGHTDDEDIHLVLFVQRALSPHQPPYKSLSFYILLLTYFELTIYFLRKWIFISLPSRHTRVLDSSSLSSPSFSYLQQQEIFLHLVLYYTAHFSLFHSLLKRSILYYTRLFCIHETLWGHCIYIYVLVFLVVFFLYIGYSV